MKPAALLLSLGCAAASAGTAQAQFSYASPGPGGGYGGGLIELLATGRSPAPRRAAPAGMPGRERAGPALDPFGEPVATVPYAGRYRTAALPGTGDAVLRREPDPRYRRQVVSYDGGEKPGTVVVDTPNRFLFLVGQDGTAIRYGIGVGRPGFEWAGTKTVSMKKEWPDWRPPAQMLRRRPDLPRYMEGGPENPLGARALYLGSSLYRIHGTNEPWTIGANVSSGCIRMTNDDVVDLYGRVPVGARVKVI